MRTYNVITTMKGGSPIVPEGAGHSCLSQPEIVPVFVRVYCETDEQAKELLSDPVQYPFVAELNEDEATPDGIPVEKVDDKELADVPVERIWKKAVYEAVLVEKIIAEKEG